MERLFWNLYTFLYGLVCKLEPYKKMINEITQEIISKKGTKLLDAGCGNGSIIKKLREEKKEISYEGVDFSIAMIKAAKKRNPYEYFYWADLTETLPYPSETFDYIVSTNVLYAIPEPEKTISEFRRILKREGKIIICTPLKGSDPKLIFRQHLAKKGWIQIFPYLLPFLLLGMMNAIIMQKSSHGSYHFFSEEEIKEIIHVERLTTTYADQDWFVVGC